MNKRQHTKKVRKYLNSLLPVEVCYCCKSMKHLPPIGRWKYLGDNTWMRIK